MQTGETEADSEVTATAGRAMSATEQVPGTVQPPSSNVPMPLFPLADVLRAYVAAKGGDGLTSNEVDSVLRSIRIVDVGAMALDDGDDAWTPLRRGGHCESIVGFEPIEEECTKANAIHAARRGDDPCRVSFLPHALGDGSRGEFRLCSAPMTSSMLEPNTPLLQRFMQLEEVTKVVKRTEMQTRRLDDLVPELGGRVDFLKLDVQGYELAVLQGAQTVLRDVLIVHTEVEFVDMYKGQPLFAEVDQFLRSAGFVFHRFASIHGRPMKPMHLLANPLQPISQQLWADAVYVRDFWDLQAHSRDDLLRTALILHEVYHSYDAVRHVLARVDPDLGQRYLERVLA